MNDDPEKFISDFKLLIFNIIPHVIVGIILGILVVFQAHGIATTNSIFVDVILTLLDISILAACYFLSRGILLFVNKGLSIVKHKTGE